MKPHFYKLFYFCFFCLTLLFLLSSFVSQTEYSVIDKNLNKVITEKLYCPEPILFETFIRDQNINSVYTKKAEEEFSVDQDWYSKVINGLYNEEYNITYDSESKVYLSANRSNNMRFTYSEAGFTASVRNNEIPLVDKSYLSLKANEKEYTTVPKWQVGVKVNSFSKDRQSKSKFSGREFFTDKNTAYIEDDNLRINYTNNKDGMRQDFIVKSKPNGTEKLRLELMADSRLDMDIKPDAVKFIDKSGIENLSYSKLKVWDANGKLLQASFESNDELELTNYEQKKVNQNSKIKNQKLFAILVNDQDAVYPVTIDPLSSSPNWNYESNQASAQSGISVATAGDVNGDGYSDVIIGANLFDNGQTNEGKVFVFHGSVTGLSITPNWTAESNQANADFGISVSTAGDVNGDGYSDVIVGSAKFDNGQNDEGKVFAYYGSSSGLSLVPNWTAESDQSGALFGTSLSTAGDVNGDGYSDVIVGAHLFDNGQSNEGRVYVYHGSSSGLVTTANWTNEINQANAYYGYSVSFAGDVNGDGYSDAIIGAYSFDNGQTDEGRAYVYLGSVSGLSLTSNWSSESDQIFANYGFSCSGAGDINGDGYSDIIVGAPKLDSGQIDEGKVFVYNGSSTGPTLTPSWTSESNQVSANYGVCVTSAGDVNGDGFCDIIVGANLYDSGQTDEGRAFIFNGSSTGLSASPDWTGESNQTNAYYGTSAATAGDVNGDGFSDVIVGAYLFDNGETDEGKTFVYYGSALILSQIENWSAESNQSSAHFGWNVSSAGDVNGDGYGDVIIGARYYDNGQSDEGRAYVYLGSSGGMSTIPSWTAEPDLSSSDFGTSVSTAGDVNGDGYSDVIVGAPYLDNGQNNEGRVYVYLGSGSGLSPTPAWTVESNQASAIFGISVSTAGDVNGDGFSDVIIGASLYDNGQTNEGSAFVYYGSPTGLSLIADWTAENNQASSEFGFSVSTAGDVNGDGYSDVIIGSRYFDNGQNDEGRTYVYYGSVMGLSLTENWTAESNQSGADFGYSVSAAGDVNGDGYGDVIVGARDYDNGQINEGRSYVYYGSLSGLSLTENWTAESNQASSRFGFSVSSAGDVNGDGYSDVIIGALYFDNVQNDEGRAFVYYGSISGLSLTENCTVESNQAGAQFGISVASAGDVNGDGFSDVIVGAPFFDNGQSDEGKAFVYYGNGAGANAKVQQFKLTSGLPVSAGNLTGKDGQVKLQLFGKSPYGRSKGKLVYELKTNGNSFSGSPLTNSVSGTGVGTFSDLLLTGKNLPVDLSGLILNKEYTWRARVQYKLTSNPYQKFGPWKYYNNYVPLPNEGFKAREDPQIYKSLNLTVYVQGIYNAGTNSIIQDTVRAYIRNSSPPFAVIDSAKVFLSNSGSGTFNFFSPPINNVPYYIQVKHRNSLETWSSTANSFINSSMTYDFTNSANKAYGNNMIQADTSPLKFALYSGEINQDGSIDLTDVVEIYNDGNNFLSGYILTDLNGDGITDLTDLVISFNNSNNFVTVKKP